MKANSLCFPRQDKLQQPLNRERAERCAWLRVQEALAIAAVDDEPDAHAELWRARHASERIFVGGAT